MKKTLLLLIGLATLLLLIASCGSTEFPTTTHSSLQPPPPPLDSNHPTPPPLDSNHPTPPPFDPNDPDRPEPPPLDSNGPFDPNPPPIEPETPITTVEKNDDDSEIGNVTDVEEDAFSFSGRDTKTDYDESTATRIVLNGSSVTITGEGATYSGSDITITQEGVYLLSGTLTNGRITVNADPNAKIQLVFDNVTLHSDNGPALFVEACDKVFITLAKNSNNYVTDGRNYTFTHSETTPDGAIFSREDLTINAQSGGKLTVEGKYKHGIVSKDDLVITGGEINVIAKNVALNGKDSVKIGGGNITLTAGSDAIRADNAEDTTKGFVYIKDGTIGIEAENDGIQAETTLRIDGGEIHIKCGSGAPTSTKQYSGTESKKGIKAGGMIMLLGGNVTINCEDDGVHSNNAFEIHAGNLTVSSGDDGIHADETLTIAGGSVTVLKSYEGLEARVIEIKNGKTSITANDDGINASSGSSNGNDFGGMWGGGGGGGMDADSTCQVIISGGYLYVNAQGDGLDSNGSLSVSGGTVLVAGPTNSGNGALDYGTTAEITGGTVIALGASGMATGFKSGTVGSFLTTFSSQSANKTFAVVDSEGRVIASFTAPKSYNSAVVASPLMNVGESYRIVTGGEITPSDEYGFTESGSVSGGTTVTTVTLTSLIVNQGGMGGGGGGMRPPRG